MNSKKVPVERHTRTKSEKEYINAIIQNLSLKRLTDQEIVDFLYNEKQIEIARSTVTNSRNRIERQAAKWYLELRGSTSKYIAAYKQRIDSLFSYQKKLHEIINSTNKDEVKIRAISELHSIEMDIFNLWKQLPNLNVSSTANVLERQSEAGEGEGVQIDDQGYEKTQIPPVDYPQERERFDRWTLESKPMSSKYVMEMKSKYGISDTAATSYLQQCHDCKRWFESENHRTNHMCIEREKS